MINYFQPRTVDKPKWFREPLKPNSLSCWDAQTGFWGTEEKLAEVQAWSKEHKCGKRTSYHTWVFATESDLMRFLLRWA